MSKVWFLLFTLFTFGQATIGGDFIPKEDKTKPWLVQISDEKKMADCTGSLISDTLVLTAFHCIMFDKFEDLPKKWVTNRGSDQYVKIKNVYLPDDEIKGEASMEYGDLAILELGEPLKTTAYVSLPDEKSIQKYYGKQDVAWLYGYGVHTIGTSTHKKVLTKEQEEKMLSGELDIGTAQSMGAKTATQLQLSIMDKARCEEVVNKPEHNVTNQSTYFICSDAIKDAQRRGYDVGMCGGDSGGPLVVKEGEGYLQIGVVSGYEQDAGFRSCGKNTGRYVNISYYSPWIKKVMDKKVAPATGYKAIEQTISANFYSIITDSGKGSYFSKNEGKWQIVYFVNDSPGKIKLLSPDDMPKKYEMKLYREIDGKLQFIDYNDKTFKKPMLLYPYEAFLLKVTDISPKEKKPTPDHSKLQFELKHYNEGCRYPSDEDVADVYEYLNKLCRKAWYLIGFGGINTTKTIDVDRIKGKYTIALIDKNGDFLTYRSAKEFKEHNKKELLEIEGFWIYFKE